MCEIGIFGTFLHGNLHSVILSDQCQIMTNGVSNQSSQFMYSFGSFSGSHINGSQYSVKNRGIMPTIEVSIIEGLL